MAAATAALTATIIDTHPEKVLVRLSRVDPDDDPNSNSNSTISQIDLSCIFELFFERRDSTEEKARRVATRSKKGRITIPADKDAILSLVMTFPKEMEIEENMYLQLQQQDEWVAVESMEVMISLIVEALWRMVEESEVGVMRVCLRISETMRLKEGEAASLRPARTTQWAEQHKFEKRLIRYQWAHAATHGRLLSVDGVKEVVARRLVLQDGESYPKTWSDRATIDRVVGRAFKVWGQKLISEIPKFLLPAVKCELKGEECSICLTPMFSTDKECSFVAVVVRLAKCHHAFHQHCLVPWLTKAPACPMCRTPSLSLPPIVS